MGGSSKKTTVGYRYFLGLHMILCHGPIDRLVRIMVDKRTAWVGSSSGGTITVAAQNLFGGDSREGGVSGPVDFENGTPTQGQNGYLVSQLGPEVPSFRGVVGLVLRRCYMGNNPYLKAWSFRAQRIHVRQNGLPQWYDAKASIPVGSPGRAPVYHTFDPNQAAVSPELSGNSVTITGIDPTKEFLVLTLQGEDSAWSRWLGYGSGPGYHDNPDDPLWWARVSVKDAGGNITHLWEESYFTREEAASAALANPRRALSGSSQYQIWLEDDFLTNRGGMSLKIEVVSSFDMNPAHIIRECLTDPDWGMGYQEADIDDASFTAAADALYEEGFGMSLLWDRQTPIEDFVKEVIRHIQASLYVDRMTGLFKLKLIRADYVTSELLVLDETCVEKVDSFSRPSFGDMLNSVTVNYWDSATATTASLTAQDTALVQMQGCVVGTTIQYPGCTKQSLAAKLATRDLHTLSTPLLSCTVYANRKAAGLNVGDAFVLDWPDYLAEPTVMRVLGLAFGDGRSNKVKITCTEDVFSFPEVAVVRPEVPEWQDPSGEPEAATIRIVEEAPYYELVQRLGQTTTDDQLSSNPDIGYLLGSAAAPAGAINARLLVDAGAGYAGNDTPMDFCPVAFLAEDIGPGTTSAVISGGQGIAEVQVGTHAQIGQELVKVTSITDTLMTFGRGVLDTVPAPHPAGTPVLFWDAFADSDGVEYVAGETLGVKMTPVSGAGVLPLEDAPEDTITFTSRAFRPYPPGNLKVGGVAYPTHIGVEDSLNLSWSHRDRVQQTAGDLVDTTFGNIGPEVGTSYKVSIFGETDSLLREVSGVTGTTYEYTLADEINDVGGSSSEEPYWPQVSTLLNMNGANDSTVFTDASNNSLTFTPSGNARIRTDQFKFGGSSGYFDGASDQLTGPTGFAGFNFGSGDFTVDLWVYLVGGGNQHIVGFWDASGAQSWHIGVAGSSGVIYFEYSLGGVYDSTRSKVSANGVFPLNTWKYVEWSRSGNTMRLFVDGVVVITHTCGTDAVHFPSTVPLKIGSNTNSQLLAGYLQDLRITKGAARNTSAYTPPAIQASRYIITGPARLNGKLRFTLESVRDGKSSYQAHDHTVRRPGYGFNYGEQYGE